MNGQTGNEEVANEGSWVGRRLVIRGQVQGIGFRWSMVEQAQRLGVGGWVRNRRDGSVEALVCGPHEQVAAMIYWAGQGPAGARVAGVEVEESAERCEEFAQAATI